MIGPAASQPRRLAMTLMVLCACLLAAVAAGCGSGEDTTTEPLAGPTLRVYSSMPLEGPDRAAALDVLRGQQIALREAGGRAGGYEVELVSLDAATPEADRWDPQQISENAQRAAEDPSTIAYVGEFHTGSSAISIPRLNEVGVLEVSPLDTSLSLTTRNPAAPDAPEKYFPKAKEFGRTFARLAPSDARQAVAQLRYMEEEGVQRLVLLTDEDPMGTAFATTMRPRARAHGIAIVGREDVDPHEQDPRELVQTIADLNPDAVFYAGAVHDGLVRLWQDLSVADPRLKLFVPGALADAPFVASIGAAAGATYVTRPVLSLASYPPAAQRFAQRFERRFGAPPLPEALYGFEAMSALLAAIRAASAGAGEGALDRADVVQAFRAIRREGTVLGDWELQPNGDSTLDRFGAYRIAGGELRFRHALQG